MAVVKPRQNRFAFGIQDAGVRADKASDLGIFAYEHDTFPTDRQGLDAGEVGIDSQDVPVLDDEISQAFFDAVIVAAHAGKGDTGGKKAKGETRQAKSGDRKLARQKTAGIAIGDILGTKK